MGKAVVSRIRTRWRGVVAVLVVAALIGCGVPPKRKYQTNPPDASVRSLPLKVAVVELEDGSSGEGFQNPFLFNNAMIPGALYGTEMVKFHHTFFGKCLAAELRDSQMFASVEYHANWDKVAADYKSYDLIVTGRLLQDRVEVKNYLYGLSIYGSIFLLLGLPQASLSREVIFDVVAFEPTKSWQSLWSHRIAFDNSYLDSLYYGDRSSDPSAIRFSAWGHKVTQTDLCTTELLQPRFLSLRNSLAATLREKHLSHGPSSLLESLNSGGKES